MKVDSIFIYLCASEMTILCISTSDRKLSVSVSAKISVSVCISDSVSFNLSVSAEISVRNRTENRNICSLTIITECVKKKLANFFLHFFKKVLFFV